MPVSYPFLDAARALKLFIPLLRSSIDDKTHYFVNLLRSAGISLVLKADFNTVFGQTLAGYAHYLSMNELKPAWIEVLAQPIVQKAFENYWNQYVPDLPAYTEALFTSWIDGVGFQYLVDTIDEDNSALLKQQLIEQLFVFYELYSVRTRYCHNNPEELKDYHWQYAQFWQLNEIEDYIELFEPQMKAQISDIHRLLRNLFTKHIGLNIKVVDNLQLRQLQYYTQAYINIVMGENGIAPIDIPTNTLDYIPQWYEQIQLLSDFLLRPDSYKNRALANYRLYLQQMYHEVVLNDPQNMSLANVYIEPYFGIHRSSLNEDDERIAHCNNHGFYPVPSNVDLHHFIDTLLPTQDVAMVLDSDFVLQMNAKVIVLLGEPGQGKSSFCKRLLHDCLLYTPQQNIYFIPLASVGKPKEWLVNPVRNIISQIQKDLSRGVVEEEEAFFSTARLNKSLIILDGLDELLISQNIDKRELLGFYKDILQQADIYHYKIIITSRLSYIDLEQLRALPLLILQLNPFQLEQQENWLQHYQIFHAETTLTFELLKTYNEKFLYLAELLKQPILLYFIADLQHPIDPTTSKAKVYETLFDQLCKTTDEQSQEERLLGMEGIGKESLRELLQQIAFIMYSNQRTYITAKQIQELSRTNSTLRKLTNNSKNEFGEALMLISYGRAAYSEPFSKKYAIVEFLHKSLQEYLTAEYIWQQFKDELCAVQIKGRSQTYLIDDIEACLSLCCDLFAPQNILIEESMVKQYLSELIVEDDSPERDLVAERLLSFWESAMSRQFLCQTPNKTSNVYLPPTVRMRRVMYGYWLCLQLLHPKKNLQPHSHNLRSQIQELWRILTLEVCYPLTLAYQNLDSYQLTGANLVNANFINAKLSKCILSFANMSQAYLINSDLKKANLTNTILRGANLSSVDMRNANLQSADMSKTDLSNADLRQTALLGAKLLDAQLRGADLSKADLRLADMRRSSLNFATLNGADMRNSFLRHTDLSFSDLTAADLRSADLRNANLQNANLTRADLRNADLRRVDLRHAILDDAKVERVDWLEYWSVHKDAPKRVLSLVKAYSIDPIPRNDIDGSKEYYVIRRKEH
ncbi:MAG TPA: pentapeptide repeat-containing protein [Chitinophagales bacterium]|nr:pentapeptide repeat-containing protein [Chitinophagales bacterium]